jgi:hypothetical protein
MSVFVGLIAFAILAAFFGWLSLWAHLVVDEHWSPTLGLIMGAGVPLAVLIGWLGL